VNAGHFPPIIINKQKEIRRLKAGCTVIGAFEKLPEIKEEQINLIGDELLMCYTDGLGELVNEYGEYFEESSLEQFIKDNNEVSAKDFAQNLEDKIDDFAKNEGLKDDIAVLLCKLV
jgi:sigma-B regulation protein RsbU (phosphoserine phosphatase)